MPRRHTLSKFLFLGALTFSIASAQSLIVVNPNFESVPIQCAGGDAIHFVRVGTLDAPDRFPPDIHIFTASKQPWVILPPHVPAVPEYYKSAEIWSAASLERRERVRARQGQTQ